LAKKKKRLSSTWEDDRASCARKVVEGLSKLMGEGTIMVLGADGMPDVAVIPTGSIGLNRALGVGGIPKGRVMEIYGPEASGKTTLTLNIIACAQEAGGLAAFIDAEHALDPAYAKRIGVDIDTLLLAQPDSGESALELCERLVCDTPVDLIVIDSVAALVPRAELAGEMGDHHVGLQARLMSQALRKLTPSTHKHQTTIIFINQLRMKIGNAFGPSETTTGGRALRFYSSVRIDVRRIATLKDGDVAIGSRVRAKVVKNKVASPHRKAEFDIIFGYGIDRPGELIDLGLESGHCIQKGTWFAYGEHRLGQGRNKATDFLRQHPAIANELEEAILGEATSEQLNSQGAGVRDAA
jgi:recombination protein RecA